MVKPGGLLLLIRTAGEYSPQSEGMDAEAETTGPVYR